MADGGVVMVTGGTGFVGRVLVDRLARDKRFLPRAASRRQDRCSFGAVEQVRIGDLGPDTDWRAAVAGVSTVVHLAARVHVMQESEADSTDAFRRANVEGTLSLACQAVEAGVRRLVFVSSIKVNGEMTLPDRAFTPTDSPHPQDPYAVSKWEAEEGLRQLARQTGLEVVIVRPPLVYGPGVRANFRRLINLVQRGLPLPLGAVNNKRSLVAVDNLVDLLTHCIDHPAAAGQTFLVSDGEDLSTPELIRRLAKVLGRPARLIAVPPALLRLAGRLARRAQEVERVIGSLQVDISHACETLDWRPPVAVDEALRRMFLPPRERWAKERDRQEIL
ncbi:MAG: SDR family oxidoreductase [Gammaproteobacteria bacterium]